MMFKYIDNEHKVRGIGSTMHQLTNWYTFLNIVNK